jgi:hypothetical protein
MGILLAIDYRRKTAVCIVVDGGSGMSCIASSPLTYHNNKQCAVVVLQSQKRLGKKEG